MVLHGTIFLFVKNFQNVLHESFEFEIEFEIEDEEGINS